MTLIDNPSTAEDIDPLPSIASGGLGTFMLTQDQMDAVTNNGHRTDRVEQWVQDILLLTEMGLPSFVLRPRTKKPIELGGFHNAVLADEATARSWLQYRDGDHLPNVGVAIDDKHILIDFDIELTSSGELVEGKVEFVNELERRGLRLPDEPTPTQDTPHGGEQQLYRLPEGYPPISNAQDIVLGVDIRGLGGYCAVPPSVFTDPPGAPLYVEDAEYVWHQPIVTPIELPVEILDAIADMRRSGASYKEYSSGGVLVSDPIDDDDFEAAIERFKAEGFREGTRDGNFARLVIDLKRHHYNRDDALAIVRIVWQGSDHHDFDLDVAEEKVYRIFDDDNYSEGLSHLTAERWNAMTEYRRRGTTSSNSVGPRADASLLLPDEFWEARPLLGHIRQAAHSRGRSADVVFHAVLARIAGAIDHTIKIPAIVGSPAPLCYFAAVVGPSGSGKSSGSAIAAELVPVGDEVADGLPVGSGEGIVEVLFDFVNEVDPVTSKTAKVKRQVRHNAIVYIDEGDALTALGTRNGATTLSTFRSIWSGQTLGQTNASNERKRIVPSGQYSYGLVIGLQPHLAGPLLDDVGAGTPQRFAWASSVDPNIPTKRMEWSGPLDWEMPSAVGVLEARISSSGFMAYDILVDPAISTEVWERDQAIQRGEIEIDPYEAHLVLLRLKVAALLAVLDRRLDINTEDWSLAQIVTETSGAVRNHIRSLVRAEADKAELATSSRAANREVVKVTAVERNLVEETVQRLVQVVRKAGEVKFRTVRDNLSRRQKDVFGEALELAIERGQVEEFEEVSETGHQTRMLRYVGG
jgi:hypothetical protein